MQHMKVLSTGFPEEQPAAKEPGRAKRYAAAGAGVLAVFIAAALVIVPVTARGNPREGASDNVPAAAEPADYHRDALGAYTKAQSGDTVAAASSEQGAVLSPVTGSAEALELSSGAGGDGLSVTELPSSDENIDEVALAAAAMEQGDTAAAEPEAPAETPSVADPPAAQEPQIIYIYIEKEPEPVQEEIAEPAEEPAGGTYIGDTEPPDWLVGQDQEIPAETAPVQEAEPAPEWLMSLLDKAMWNNPYDGGPLCQQSWAQIPCAVTEGTRAYVEFGSPLIWLTQGDLLGFVHNSIRTCDADWFTIVGSDGYGIQFPGCVTDYAVYGPLDEYGQVTEVMYFLFLDENGFYAIAPVG